jgi:membrane fusion protein, copper/silver efflux system
MNIRQTHGPFNLPINPSPSRGIHLGARAVLALALLSALVLSAGCSASAATSQTYYCPMHPNVISDRAGDCSICGMHLVAKKADAPAPRDPEKPEACFACPMHPQVTSDHPADCTICGMHLTPKSPPKGGAGTLSNLAPISLSESQRRELGLTFGTVERATFGSTASATATVVPDESRIFRVVARADGYVDRLDVQYAGARVRKGQPMLSIYSPSIQAAQQQFIGQMPTEGRRFASSVTRTAAPSENDDRDDAFRAKLQYWGFGDAQVDRIQKTRKIENSLDVESPSSGVVTDKSAVLGQRVVPGDLLFTVMDLSVVWAEVQVPEMDAPRVRPGMDFLLNLNALPGKAFKGRVKFALPVLDPQVHTMKVCLEIPNPKGELKPGMLGTATASLEENERLAVPEGAILHAGHTSYAFVDDGEFLSPREVALGAHGGGYYEVTSGLKEGEKVATSAVFLLDSESSLKAAFLAAERR